jgi:hypothetical protein
MVYYKETVIIWISNFTFVTWVIIASTTSCLNGRKTIAWYLTGKIT